MAIILDRDQGLLLENNEQMGLECPYCSVYSHMSPESIPHVDDVLQHRPKHVGLVYRCDACSAPVFLRFAVKQFGENHVELYRNFVELERPKERFAFSYLPKETEVLFREALSCYSNNNFNAFASMCRRSASSAYASLGDGGRLRAFEEIVIAQDIAGIDDDTFAPIKFILFDTGEEEDLPLLSRAQAGILLEVLKDMFYQCFVRRGKLTRALKVRRFFVQEREDDLASSA
jgi:DNA-directed RNA polymerase subunit RPC12/RpoP